MRAVSRGYLSVAGAGEQRDKREPCNNSRSAQPYNGAFGFLKCWITSHFRKGKNVESKVAKSGRSVPLLWNDRSAVALCAVALIVTVGIVAFQMSLRRGLFDPSVVPIFHRLFLFQDYAGSLVFITALLLGLVKPIQRAGAKVARLVDAHRAGAVTGALLGFAISAVYIYRSHPLAMDEYVPFFQSQVFVAGKLLGQFPPDLVDWLIFPSFQGHFIFVSKLSGEFGSAYWPGFAMLLTPFAAAGVPWLCNPVLGAAALLAIHRLTWSVTRDGLAAAMAVMLTLASPAFVINAISYYSMTAHLLCNAAFVLLLLAPTPGRAVLAGAVGGLALTLHNPLPHVLFAAPWLLWLLWRRDRWRILPSLIGGYLPFVVVVGFGWHAVVSELARGAAVASAAAPDPLDAVVRSLSGVLAWPSPSLLQVRLIDLMKLWLWAVPAMIVLAGVGFWRRRDDVRFRLLLASAILTLLGYLFVPADQGHGWGFRYFHSVWFVLPIFAAAAVASRWRQDEGVAPQTPGPLAGYAQGTALTSLLLMVPFFAWQVNSFMTSHLAQIPTADTGRPRVVIINPAMQYYAQDLAQNDPFLRESVIRMVTRGRKADEQMMASQFPGLTRLSETYKGSVWGYADEAGEQSKSASLGVGTQEKRE